MSEAPEGASLASLGADLLALSPKARWARYAMGGAGLEPATPCL
jgi:hypothetical protein